MTNSVTNTLRVGVYVDVANITRSGGYGMQYDVLRDFACRGEATPLRLNAYVGYDVERAKDDFVYRDAQLSFHDALREQGYKVIVKPVKWYSDDRGNRIGKANADLDLAVDALLQSENMDRILLATGDGDFVKVVNALQNRGCRVEVTAFEGVSSDLRREADMFMSGYLIPGLLPTTSGDRTLKWGEAGSRVRGTCYYFNPAKGFGFMRFMSRLCDGLWNVDPRKDGSPFEGAFFHISDLNGTLGSDDLPSRDLIFEFDLTSAPRPVSLTNGESSLRATRIKLIKANGKHLEPLALTASTLN
jgi:hypothetical protein